MASRLSPISIVATFAILLFWVTPFAWSQNQDSDQSREDQAAKLEKILQTDEIVRYQDEKDKKIKAAQERERDTQLLEFLDQILTKDEKNDSIAKIVYSKNWSQARISLSKELKTNEKKSLYFLLMGAVEERLDNPDDSYVAYEKYLSLNTNPVFSNLVRSRFPEVETKIAIKENHIWGPESDGFYFSLLPIYHPHFFKELNASKNLAWDIGFNVAKVFIGYRRQTGEFTGDIQVPDESTNPPAYNSIPGGGKITHQELYANIQHTLVEPYTSLGSMELTTPIFIGVAMNTIEVNNDTYGNFGYDLGYGIGLRGYTKSHFSWYAQALYHYGLPFWGIRRGGAETSIRNENSDDVQGKINCIEGSIGFIYLFGKKDLK